MPRERWLPLGGLGILEELWEGFPDSSRRQVIELYARLIARAAGLITSQRTQEEIEHEALADRSAGQDPS
jgi:hypothetical protein